MLLYSVSFQPFAGLSKAWNVTNVPLKIFVLYDYELPMMKLIVLLIRKVMMLHRGYQRYICVGIKKIMICSTYHCCRQNTYRCTAINPNHYIRSWSVLIQAFILGLKENFEYQYLYLIIDITAMINPIIYVLLPCMGYLFGTFDKNGNIKSYIFLWLYDLFYEVHRGTYRDKQ